MLLEVPSTHLSRSFGRLIGLHSNACHSIQCLCIFSAMDCTFQAEIILVAIVSQYIVQRLTQEAEMVFIYSVAVNARSFIYTNNIRVTQEIPSLFTSSLPQDLVRLRRIYCQRKLSTSCRRTSPCPTMIINEPAVVLLRQEVVVNVKILSTAYITAARTLRVRKEYCIPGEIFH